MFLGKIANRFAKDPFEVFDEQQDDFVASDLRGRFIPADRFLSIYNRPTRMRLMLVEPDAPLPPSGVIRHPKTGACYLVGAVRQDTRYDVQGGNTYEQVVTLHECTPMSGMPTGLCEVHRKQLSDPSVQDWLVDTTIGTYFSDFEFRTSASEAGMSVEKVGNYYGWLPHSVEIQQWDMLHINGDTFRVVDSFADMGMRGIRADKEPDPRIDFVLIGEEREYDPVRQMYNATPKEYNVTGFVSSGMDEGPWLDTESYTRIIVRDDDILFKPTTAMKAKVNGVLKTITQVSHGMGEKQYILRVT